MFSVGIWMGSFRCTGIFLLQWQGENFAHRKHLKFCNFQPAHCASKNSISPKLSNRFSKSLPQLEDVQGGHFCRKFQVRKYFTFTMAMRKLCASTTFEILPHSTCTMWQQEHYISKGIEPIFEIFASARRCSGWEFGWTVSGAQELTFAMARWKLCASKTFEILQLSTCTLCEQKFYIPKVIQPIFEIFGSARRYSGWAFV